MIVDTSSWVHYFNSGNGHELIEAALDAGRVRVTPLIAAELLSGSMSGPRRSELEEFIADLPLVPSPLEHWFRVGHLRSMLRTKGYTVSTPDAHIAQAALDTGDALLSSDAIFKKIAKHAKLKLA